MASTRLTRTFSAGNRKKWTMSMWVKRSALGVDQKLMGKFTSQPDRFALLFNSSNQLQQTDCLETLLHFIILHLLLILEIVQNQIECKFG